MKLLKAIQLGREQLAEVSDASKLDAERLLLSVIEKQEMSWVYAHSNEVLNTDQLKQFEELVEERKTGRPLAYILGEWEFYGRPFYVNENVLVPRPETEELIEKAQKFIRPQMIVADIGTGSGIIAVTLALETEASIIATDISPAALEVAKRNAARHGVKDRIEFLEGDMLAPIVDRQIDLIVSNPPYVPTDELSQRTNKDTRGLIYEPRVALDGGYDGTKYVQQLQNQKLPAFAESFGGKIISLNH